MRKNQQRRIRANKEGRKSGLGSEVKSQRHQAAVLIVKSGEDWGWVVPGDPIYLACWLFLSLSAHSLRIHPDSLFASPCLLSASIHFFASSNRNQKSCKLSPPVPCINTTEGLHASSLMQKPPYKGTESRNRVKAMNFDNYILKNFVCVSVD